jgi:hypothetical protein
VSISTSVSLSLPDKVPAALGQSVTFKVGVTDFSGRDREILIRLIGSLSGPLPAVSQTLVAHLSIQVDLSMLVPAGMPPGFSAPKIHVFHGASPMNFQQAMQKPTPIIKNISINIEQILLGCTVPVDIERWILENGNKVFERETIYVNIPKGVDENELIILRDKGNVLNEQFKGDVKIFVNICNNTPFKRVGLDLIFEK